MALNQILSLLVSWAQGVPWEGRYLITVAVGQITLPILIKKASGRDSKSVRLFYQYLFLVLISLVIFLIEGAALPTSSSLALVLLGVGNSFACYLQWHAYSISLSQSAMYAMLESAVSMVLALIFLQEAQYLNSYVLLGLLLLLLSYLLLSSHNSTRDSLAPHRQVLKYVVAYSVIWGTSDFSVRVFSLTGLSSAAFLLLFYSGSLVGASMIAMSAREKFSIPKLDLGFTFLLAATIWLTMFCWYWTLGAAPVVVAKPLYQTSGMIIPMIVGIVFFKESAALSKKRVIGILFGMVGGILLACMT